jgi:intracellular multiplication protein IcmN
MGIRVRSEHTNYIIVTSQIIGLSFLLFLSACRRDNNYVREQELPKLPCKEVGACDSTIISKMNKLNKRGIRVITMGQNYLISVPAWALFDDQTPHLKWGSYGLLNELSDFLKQFRKIAITITSYSSKYISVPREKALTLALRKGWAVINQ